MCLDDWVCDGAIIVSFKKHSISIRREGSTIAVTDGAEVFQLSKWIIFIYIYIRLMEGNTIVVDCGDLLCWRSVRICMFIFIYIYCRDRGFVLFYVSFVCCYLFM